MFIFVCYSAQLMENHSDSERTEIWSDDWDSPPAAAVEGTRKEKEGSTSCKLQCAQTMEDHLDTESTEILGDWDSPPLLLRWKALERRQEVPRLVLLE